MESATEFFNSRIPRWTPSVPETLPDGRRNESHVRAHDAGDDRRVACGDGRIRRVPHAEYERVITPQGAYAAMVVRPTRSRVPKSEYYRVQKIAEKKGKGFLFVDIPPDGRDLADWQTHCLEVMHERIKENDKKKEARAKRRDRDLAKMRELGLSLGREILTSADAIRQFEQPARGSRRDSK